MTHKKLILLAAFVALVGTVTVGSATYAREGVDDSPTVAQTETENETETETETDDSLRSKVEARKAELKQRIEAKRTEMSEKLADKRLQACEKRQTQINKIFDRSTDRNRKHLAVFQKIEQRVKEFYVNKNLSTEGYDEAVANADAKEAAAVAAIETSAEVNFDCATTDGAKPGSLIKEVMQSRHAALKEYRTAVKDLILVVKKAHGQQQSTGTEQESTTEEAQ